MLRRYLKVASASAGFRVLLGVALATLPHLVAAHSYQTGALQIDHPSSRETAPGAPNGVGYLRIEHNGEQVDRWLAAESPRARRVELHKSRENDGMRSMKHVALPLELQPGETFELQPGGYHLMLMGLDRPLRAGEHVPLKLRFERAGDIEVELVVEELGGAGKEASPGSSHTGH
ncbi:MAG: hypothetical protein CL583_05655 [Alteromonadaceae bacterium]|nr:hypothetical protein [Alteromonadaceae bacterium]|tara:strand:- start:318 stop:842 length:525 start_codon:yes stop_codon:yes gene_type:complete